MPAWTFYDYVESSGANPFVDWHSGLQPDAQAFIDARILQMSGLLKWSEKWISKYRGTEKIFELRITYMKVQYRPLGCYAPARSFVLLAGAIEKDSRLPKETVDAAVRRQKTFEVDFSYARPHRYY